MDLTTLDAELQRLAHLPVAGAPSLDQLAARTARRHRRRRAVGTGLAGLAVVGVLVGAPRIVGGDDGHEPVIAGTTPDTAHRTTTTTTTTTTEPSPSAQQDALAAHLVDFAREPSDLTFAQLPFADDVELALGGDVVAHRPGNQLRSPAAWDIDLAGFRARTGIDSVLRELAGQPEVTVTGEPHQPCNGAITPAPPAADGMALVSIQPTHPRDDGCLDWYAADLFLDTDGNIAVVSLDLYEP